MEPAISFVAPSRLSCDSPAALQQDGSSGCCSSSWSQMFLLSVSSTGPRSSPAWQCHTVPYAGHPPAPHSCPTGEMADVSPACSGGALGSCLACSHSALPGLDFNFLCKPRAALWVGGGTQRWSWLGATLHQAQLLSALSTNSCLPLVGRELPPPAKSLPGSPVFPGGLPAATWIHFSKQ